MPSKAAATFRKKHKPDPAYRTFTAADRKRLAGRLSEAMLALLEADGWCSYDGQVIWLCDPDDWAEAGKAWLPRGKKTTDVIARSAFGELVAWDGKQFWLILPHDLTRVSQTADPEWLFGVEFQNPDFHFNAELAKETKAARKACGDLSWDEMFNFAPALALGGTRADAQLAREDARVALDILHQLGPIQSIEI